MIDVVDMDELQDPNLASKKARKGKDPVIEVSPDREEETEVDVGAPRPTYDDTRCCMDPSIVYKWGDIYQMFPARYVNSNTKSSLVISIMMMEYTTQSNTLRYIKWLCTPLYSHARRPSPKLLAELMPTTG